LIIAISRFIFNDINNVNTIIFRPLLLLVMVVVRMNSVCVEIANVLGLIIQLIVVIEVSIIINDFNLFL